jgi:microcystin-dependent protein
MSDPFVAEIRIVGFNFAPRGWAFCRGQLLSISQNTALFSLLGTTYGGDGRSNFALPDLQGNAPMQPGQGPGLTDRVLGETGGSSNVTLLPTQIPVHTHSLSASALPATSGAPANNSLARSSGGAVYADAGNNVALSPASLGITGGSQPHNNMQPYLTLNFVIALQGIFPPRS